jgi:hypothetical protein
VLPHLGVRLVGGTPAAPGRLTTVAVIVTRTPSREALTRRLRAADLLDFSRAAVDSSHLRAMKGGPATDPSPVDGGKTGSKHHVIVDAQGIPLATITTGGNRNNVTQLIPLIEAVPPIRGERGQPLRRQKNLYADRGHDHETYRDQVRRFEMGAARLALRSHAKTGN